MFIVGSWFIVGSCSNFGSFFQYKRKTYPRKTNKKMAAVISAPLEAGDNIPSMAKTKRRKENRC